MMARLLLIGVVACLLSMNVLGEGEYPHRMVWKGDPLTIELSTSAEQRLTFRDAQLIWADIPNKLKDKLTTQIVDNNLYWKAKAPFVKERITIGEEGTDKVFLLDVSASHKKLASTRIVIANADDPFSKPPAPAPPINSVVDAKREASTSPVAGYATLFRFAAAEVYAPERLRLQGTGIVKVSISPKQVYNLIPNRAISVKIAAVWRSNNLYITALELVNQSRLNAQLDPRTIRGMWKAALFQHGILRANGRPDDNTTLYLISDQPFNAAITRHPMIKLEG